MTAVLEPFEIGPHLRRGPARVAGELGDVVPVGVVRIDENHRVVRGAPAERARARIVDAVDARPAMVLDELRIAPLPHVIAIVADEEVPGHRGVFGGERVEGGNVVVVRQAIDVGLNRIAAAQFARVAAGLEQDDAPARFRQARGYGAAACAGADDEVFTVGGGGCGVRRAHRLKRSLQPTFAINSVLVELSEYQFVVCSASVRVRMLKPIVGVLDGISLSRLVPGQMYRRGRRPCEVSDHVRSSRRNSLHATRARCCCR